jgi:hypothetical protein
MDPDVDRLLQDHDAIKRERTGHEATWNQITELIYPDGLSPWDSNTISGQPTRREIFDNTGEDACEMAATAWQAMTTSPAARWFELGLFDEIYERDTVAGAYLWNETTKMLRCFRHPTARFNLAMDEDNMQLMALGNSCLHVEDRPGKLPLYRACPMAKQWWRENADGELDEHHREFDLPAIAAYEKWGDRLPKRIRDLANGKGSAYDLVPFLHINRPRRDYDRTKSDRRNMPFRSTYVCLQEPSIVVDGGSRECEYVGSRWRKRPNEMYGRGCGHKALSDIDILQRMVRTVLLAGEMTVGPPILAPENGVTGQLSLRNRAINVVRAEYLANGAAPRAMITNTRVDIGLELIADRRDLVRRSFLKQLLEMIRDPHHTATQTLAIEEEQKRGLTPLLGRQENERLGPLVGRTYNILARMPGVMEPPPPELRGLPLQPNFDSPAARAMQLAVARAIAQSFEAIAPLIKAVGDPALWDNFDLDETVRAEASSVGVPGAMLRPIDVRDRMRMQRLAISQQKADLEAAKDASTVVKNLAPMAKAGVDLVDTVASNATTVANSNAAAPPPAAEAA